MAQLPEFRETVATRAVEAEQSCERDKGFMLIHAGCKIFAASQGFVLVTGMGAKRKSDADGGAAAAKKAPKCKAKAAAKAAAAAPPAPPAPSAVVAGSFDDPSVEHHVPSSPALDLFLKAKSTVLLHPKFQDLPTADPAFVGQEPYKRSSWQQATANGVGELQAGLRIQDKEQMP